LASDLVEQNRTIEDAVSTQQQVLTPITHLSQHRGKHLEQLERDQHAKLSSNMQQHCRLPQLPKSQLNLLNLMLRWPDGLQAC
jgi:hypothetical protein